MQNENNHHEFIRQEKKQRPLAVVTGASSGIGYELAKVFAKNEFDLIVAADDRSIADAGNAFRALGANVDTVHTDLSTYEGVDVLVRKINEKRDRGTPLEAIAINAGVGVEGDFISTDLHDEIRLINLNIISAVHLTKHVLPHFLNRGCGRLLFTSSLAAGTPGPHIAVYAASKAFVQYFAEAIRHEVKDSGITVTALQPGPKNMNFDASDFALEGYKAMIEGREHVVFGSWAETKTKRDLCPE
jgi:short-subunit dehydrogenase